MEFASSVALTVGTVPHPHLLLCLPDPGREKEGRFKAYAGSGCPGKHSRGGGAQHPRWDLGLPPQGPWASCPPRRLSRRGWSFGVQFPLSSFADDLGISSEVSGVFGHGWCPTFHRRPSSFQIFCTYLKQELLCLPVILFPSSQMKLFLLAICFSCGFLSRNETGSNRNSAPSHVTSPCKEAHLLLFAPKSNSSWSQWLSLSGCITGGDTCAKPHLFTVSNCNVVLFFHQDSCTSSLPLPVLPGVTLSSEDHPGKLLDCACVTPCRDTPGIPSHSCWQTNYVL